MVAELGRGGNDEGLTLEWGLVRRESNYDHSDCTYCRKTRHIGWPLLSCIDIHGSAHTLQLDEVILWSNPMAQWEEPSCAVALQAEEIRWDVRSPLAQ